MDDTSEVIKLRSSKGYVDSGWAKPAKISELNACDDDIIHCDDYGEEEPEEPEFHCNNCYFQDGLLCSTEKSLSDADKLGTCIPGSITQGSTCKTGPFVPQGMALEEITDLQASIRKLEEDAEQLEAAVGV